MNKRAMAAWMIAINVALAAPLAALASPPGGGPGGDSGNVTWSGATEITSSATVNSPSWSSTSADENAVLIDTSGTVKVTSPTVVKSGGTSASDNYSFYGINSAVMCKGGGTTTINGGTIKTTAAGANGVFSYGANNGTTNAAGDGTTVNISNATITTTAQGSGGIMTTYGGTTNATNLTITTSGGSSAPIRTDRGGGWVTVKGGTYTSNGQGSPAIYSTADVSVSNATLISNASEGTCIEGTGSIELTDCTLTATNHTLNGNAQFYDTIMIYQSMSGDASDGTSVFTMTGGTLNSKQGDVFHVTNTGAVINLTGVTVNNSDSDQVFLSVCDDGWSGNDNTATLNARNQTIKGALLVGSDSSLTLNLSGSSAFTGYTSGKISNDKGSTISSSIGTVKVTMSGGSALWKLTADSTVSSISGSGKINYNGHTLTVGSTKYTSGSPGGSIVEESSEEESSEEESSEEQSSEEESSEEESSEEESSEEKSTESSEEETGEEEKETSAPAKITSKSITANPSARTIKLTWAAKNAVKYQIAYRKAGGSWTKVSTKKTSYTLRNLTARGLYEVKVRGINAAGKAGTYCKPVYCYLRTMKASVTAGKKAFRLSWSKVKGATGYQIRYSAKKSMAGSTTLKISSRLTSKVIKKLKSGTTWYVQIRPLKKSGGKVYSGIYNSTPLKVTVK